MPTVFAHHQHSLQLFPWPTSFLPPHGIPPPQNQTHPHLAVSTKQDPGEDYRIAMYRETEVVDRQNKS